MATIWGINGYFQSFGALSIVKVNAQWFHVRERGTFAGIFGVLIRFGLILAFSGVPLIASVLPLAYAFWVPAAVVAVLFALNYRFMNDSPQDAGFEDLDTGDAAAGESTERAGEPRLRAEEGVRQPRSRGSSPSRSMMIGMVRRSTIDSWYPKYFKEIHLGGPDAARLVRALPGDGVGHRGARHHRRLRLRHRLRPGVRAGAARRSSRSASSAWPWCSPSSASPTGCTSGRGWRRCSLSLLSFFVNGAHGMIGGAASMDFGGRKAAATAAGLFDGMQYLASSLVGIGMGYTLDHWGWKAWQFVPIPFAVIGALLISRLWNVMPTRRAGH